MNWKNLEVKYETQFSEIRYENSELLNVLRELRKFLRQLSVYTLCTVVSRLLTCKSGAAYLLRILLNLLTYSSVLTVILSSLPTQFQSNLFFLALPLPLPLPHPFPPAVFGVTFGWLAGVAPSISTTSSNFLLDFPVSPDLPGLPGCLFPVINLLNGVVWHLNSAAQPGFLQTCDLVIQDVVHECCHSSCLFICIWVDASEVW